MSSSNNLPFKAYLELDLAVGIFTWKLLEWRAKCFFLIVIATLETSNKWQCQSVVCSISTLRLSLSLTLCKYLLKTSAIALQPKIGHMLLAHDWPF